METDSGHDHPPTGGAATPSRTGGGPTAADDGGPPTILLLNPPGDQTFFRDYYCTKVSKAHYYYHPVDLVYLSGTLSRVGRVEVIDAIAERLPVERCLERATRLAPDVVLFLISSPSYYQDVDFLTRLHAALPGARFIGTGDVYREFREAAFDRHPFLDAVILDFSTEDILTYLDEPGGRVIDNVLYRHRGEVVAGEERHGKGELSIATPRWDLFSLDHYSFPFERRGRFASILTDFGCAFDCSFCPISTLGFKLRPVAAVIEEIELLCSFGVRELFFRDQTFGVHRRRTIELCRALEPLDLSWTCFTRVDTLSEAILGPMKAAGCHTVMFGIESADEELLRSYHKNTTRDHVRRAVELCRRHGVDTVGTFIIGLPGDTRSSTLATLEFAKRLGLDYASFNIAMPRFGTSFRDSALASGWASEDDLVLESSRSAPIWKNQTMTNQEIVALHRRVKRGFYLRPSYLAKRLLGIRTLHQLRNSLEGFYHLMLKY